MLDHLPGVNRRRTPLENVPLTLVKLHSGALLSAGLFGTAWLGAAACSQTPAPLACHVQYADTLQSHVVEATSNPYAVPSIHIEGRFDFRAIYVTEPADLAGLSVYVYQTTDGKHALVHQLALRPPYRAAQGRFGITGLNSVYDERARELQYWCGFAKQGDSR